MLSPFIISLKQTISISEDSRDRLIFHSPLVTLNLPQIQLKIEQVSPGLRTAINLLATDGGTEAELTDLVAQLDGFSTLPRFYYYLEQFINLGMICYTLRSEACTLATLVPLVPHSQLLRQLAVKDKYYLISRFAYCHRINTEMVLESPLSHAKIIFKDSRCAALIAELSTPKRVSDVVSSVSGMSLETIQHFFSLLFIAKMLTDVTADDQISENQNQALVQWEFHDLLFHSRTRIGRHDNPIGRTCRFLDQIPQQPVVKPKVFEQSIQLYQPNIQQLKATDSPFTLVLEHRKSIRHSNENQWITKQQLGEFLYRCARIREIFPKDYGEGSNRPYPNSGGRYELELYVTVNTCETLTSGLYHYCPQNHQLGKIADRNRQVERLLEDARRATGQTILPQILITITARFQRVAWAYESIAYANLLKGVGALYQTMYLVATAMNLAPCANGCGNADLFAAAIATDYYVESSVGEFILGSKPTD